MSSSDRETAPIAARKMQMKSRRHDRAPARFVSRALRPIKLCWISASLLVTMWNVLFCLRSRTDPLRRHSVVRLVHPRLVGVCGHSRRMDLEDDVAVGVVVLHEAIVADRRTSLQGIGCGGSGFQIMDGVGDVVEDGHLISGIETNGMESGASNWGRKIVVLRYHAHVITMY